MKEDIFNMFTKAVMIVMMTADTKTGRLFLMNLKNSSIEQIFFKKD